MPRVKTQKKTILCVACGDGDLNARNDHHIDNAAFLAYSCILSSHLRNSFRAAHGHATNLGGVLQV